MSNVFAPRIRVRVQPPGAKEPVPLAVERVTEWTFEDDESKADKLVLTIDNRDLRYPDDPTFEHGGRIFARWGSQGLGPEVECIIQKWPGPIYPTFQVEAHGDGITLNKTKLTRAFEKPGGIRRSDVVRAIANEFGYGPAQQFIEDTVELYDIIQFRGKTAGELLFTMAKRESKNGVPFVYYVDSTGLHFHPRRVEQAPSRVYEFVGSTIGAESAAKLRKFPTFKASVQAKPGAVAVAGVNPTTGQKVTGKASNNDNAGRPGLAPIVLTIDAQTGVKTFKEDIASTAVAPTGAQTPEEANKVAGAALAKSSSMPVECTFEVDGDPHFMAKSVVELRRIGTMLSGNYYVKKIVHQGKGGDYACMCTALRDGVNRTGAPAAAASAAASTAKQNDASGPNGGAGGTNAPPELEPQVTIDGPTGKKTYSYVPKTGQNASK
jgi:hypothetical protein